MPKTFHSLNAVKKAFLPKAYKKEKEREAIERLGMGRWLAKRFLAEMRRGLKSKKQT